MPDTEGADPVRPDRRAGAGVERAGGHRERVQLAGQRTADPAAGVVARHVDGDAGAAGTGLVQNVDGAVRQARDGRRALSCPDR